MDSNKELSLYYPVGTVYDNCAVSSFLRGLFARCHKKESTPDLVIAGNITAIKHEIAALGTGDGLTLSYEYLEAMECSLPDATFRYALIYRNNTPALFVYFQLFTLSAENFNLEKNKGFVKGILGFFLKLKKARVLISGNALRTETPCFSYNKALFTKEEAVAAIAGIAEKIKSDEHITAVILKDMPGAAAQGRQVLDNMGYSTPWEDNVMEMEIDPSWQTLHDYTSVLTRKYKTRANKVLASGKPLTSINLTEEQVARYLPEIKELFAALIDKQSFTLTSRGINSIARLKRVYRDDFDVVGFFDGQKLVAFYSAFVNTGNYELYYVGFDYELNNQYQLYFNLLFAGLEKAITLKKKQLKLGRTSFDAKASIGAKPKPTDYLIKIANTPDVVVKWFACYFSSLEDAQWKLRNPLKTA